MVKGGKLPMTDMQKEQILKLRSEGLGYIRIAREMGISENTIKSFCRRNARTGVSKLTEPISDAQLKHFCQYCGIEVEQTSGRKMKKFCSDRCRMKWWNAHSDKIVRHKTHHYKCPCCGREFEVYGNSRRKYCSHPCYINARFKGGASHE
jgi:Response regulator containing a CheY-like receiver domain and an HTH DNA-binding domain